MRGQNDDEVQAFAEMTRDRAVAVRFIEVMPVHENVDGHTNQYISATEILDRIRANGDLQPVEGPKGNGPRATTPSTAPPAASASSRRSPTTTATRATASVSPPTAG